MLSVLLEGTLIAAPVPRTSSAGKPYTIARMRANGEDGETVWVSLIAFDLCAAEALAALANGDSLAIAGRAALTTWEKGGQHHAGLKVTANRVMSIYEAGKRRGTASSRPPEATA